MNGEVAPRPPTTLLWWRHGFADAKRRGFKISIFKVQVSASKICKLDFKFEYKELRRSIFELDEVLLNLATGVTSSVMTEPNLKVSACSCDHKGSKAKYRAKRQALVDKSFC